MRAEPEYVETQVLRALATDPRVGEPSLEVSVRGRTIQVFGRVGSEDQRDAISEVVTELCPDYEVRCHVEVAPMRTPEVGEEEKL